MSFQSFRLWSLRTAQTRPERGPSRSEPLRIAQSAPRAAQSRPERSLRVAQSAPRAAASEEPLRIARSVPRAAQSRSELLEKPIGELGVTCTVHIRCSVLLHLVPSSPCMYMHGFALVYICICFLFPTSTYLCLSISHCHGFAPSLSPQKVTVIRSTKPAARTRGFTRLRRPNSPQGKKSTCSMYFFSGFCSPDRRRTVPVLGAGGAGEP